MPFSKLGAMLSPNPFEALSDIESEKWANAEEEMEELEKADEVTIPISLPSSP